MPPVHTLLQKFLQPETNAEKYQVKKQLQKDKALLNQNKFLSKKLKKHIVQTIH